MIVTKTLSFTSIGLVSISRVLRKKIIKIIVVQQYRCDWVEMIFDVRVSFTKKTIFVVQDGHTCVFLLPLSPLLLSRK